MDSLYEKNIFDQIKLLDEAENAKQRFDNKLLCKTFFYTLLRFDIYEFKDIINSNVNENNISFILEEFKDRYEYQELQNCPSEQSMLKTAFKYIFLKILNYLENGKSLIPLDDKAMIETLKNPNIFSIFVCALRESLQNKSPNESLLRSFFEILENICDESHLNSLEKLLFLYFINKFKESLMYSNIEFNSFGQLDKKESEEAHPINHTLENLKKKYLNLIGLFTNLVKEFDYLEKFKSLFNDFENDFNPKKNKTSVKEITSKRRGTVGENEIKNTLKEIDLNQSDDEEKIGNKRKRSSINDSELEELTKLNTNNKRNVKPKVIATNELARTRGKKENPINSKQTIKNDKEIKVKKGEIKIKTKQKDVKRNKYIEPSISEEEKEIRINKKRLGSKEKKENTLIKKEEVNQHKLTIRKKSLKHDKGSVISKSKENLNDNNNFRTRLNKHKIQNILINQEVEKEKSPERNIKRVKRSLSINNEKLNTEETKQEESKSINRNFRMNRGLIKNQLDKSTFKESKEMIKIDNVKSPNKSLVRTPQKSINKQISLSHDNLRSNKMESVRRSIVKSPVKIELRTPEKSAKKQEYVSNNKFNSKIKMDFKLNSKQRNSESKLKETRKGAESLNIRTPSKKKLNLTPEVSQRSNKKPIIEQSSFKKYRSENSVGKEILESRLKSQKKLITNNISFKKTKPAMRKNFNSKLNEVTNKKNVEFKKNTQPSLVAKNVTTRQTRENKIHLKKPSLNLRSDKKRTDINYKSNSKKRERKQVNKFKS